MVNECLDDKMKRLCARRRKQNSVEMSLLTAENH